MDNEVRSLLTHTYNEVAQTEERLRAWQKTIAAIVGEMLNDAHALKTCAIKIETLLGNLEDEEAKEWEAKALVAKALEVER